MTKRKQYSQEFKIDACSLVMEQNYTRTDAAASLGIGTPMLGRWIRECYQEDTQSFRGHGALTTEQTTIRELKNQVKKLQQEKEILKKAASIFIA